MERIVVEISPKGEVRIETHGYVGQSCRDATRALEQALGLQVGDRELKPEHHHLLANGNHLRVGGGR